jgi:hypothetical protein
MCTTVIYSHSPDTDTGSSATESLMTAESPAHVPLTAITGLSVSDLSYTTTTDSSDEATDSEVESFPASSGAVISFSTPQTEVAVSSRRIKLAPPTSWKEGYDRYAAAKRLAAQVGLHAVNVEADDASLFRAVCVSNCGVDNDCDHKDLHQKVDNYVKDNSLDFEKFAKENNLCFDNDSRVASNEKKMVRECAAVANVLKKQINVYIGDSQRVSYYVPHSASSQSPCKCNNSKRCQCINVLYFDTQLSNEGHYKALVKGRPAEVNFPPSVARPLAGGDEGEGTPV